MIEKGLERVYKRIMNIDYQTTAQYIVENFKNNDYPIMMDLYDELKTMRDEADEINNMIEKEKLNECIALFVH